MVKQLYHKENAVRVKKNCGKKSKILNSSIIGSRWNKKEVQVDAKTCEERTDLCQEEGKVALLTVKSFRKIQWDFKCYFYDVK